MPEMKGRIEEAEVVVRIDQMDHCIFVCVSSWPAMSRKMTKHYGPSLDANRGGQSARWKLPFNAITFRRLGTKPRGKGFLASKPPTNTHSDGPQAEQ